ncbi:MAG: TlpA family protein disulfide reductase [Bacteroidales bacterium]|nr:TlpA family protein disulfide reductase [Bacteroidales bacterium]MCF8390248.1 TlpA family protein disulfide reductase [Bacteroidales bacterium]
MNNKAACFILLFIVLHSTIYSQKLIVQKESPDVASQELTIYSYNQAFFDFKIPVLTVISGDTIEVEANLDEATCLYIDYGPYETFFYAEPGKSYVINLPGTKNFSNDWKVNPYFKPSKFHLQVFENGINKEVSGLNEKIKQFDSQFEPFNDKQLLRYYDPAFATKKLDSFLLEQNIPDSLVSGDFYRSYIFYKKGILEFNLKTHNLDELTEKYFTNKDAYFSNPAYRELFMLMFQSYFNYLSDKEKYKDIALFLATKQYAEIKDYVSDIELFNEEIIFSNILLNEIYQAYYSKYFDKNKLLSVLKSMIQNSTDPDILYASEKLEELLTSLEVSYPAPEFSTVNIQGDQKKLSDFKGRYVYLCFSDLKSISALRELEYLKYLHSRFSKELEILYFISGEEVSDIVSFVEWHNIQWQVFSLDQNRNLVQDYKVLAFPIFYLIDTNGILLRNPAPNPSENFELIFTEILRSGRNL